MKKDFKKYSLGDFLLDIDFCGWVRNERPDLDDYYRMMIKEFPDCKEDFDKARQLIRFFDDEKIKTEPIRKLQTWENILNESKKKRRFHPNLFLRIAASIVVIFLVASVWYYFSGNNSEFMLPTNELTGYTETKLILDNGEEIKIDSDHSEIVYGKKGEEIRVNDRLLKNNENTRDAEPNRLIVPYGKQSKVTLADGTTVWLNAGSQLLYSSRFEDDKREVYLSGEAFFDVTSNPSQPFHVIISDMRIKVTGTRFNVTSYPGDQTSQTILLSGKVSAKENKTFAREIDLNPGERITYNKEDRLIEKDKVNIELYSSWINGYLMFEDETISEVLKKLERFYNQKIIVEGNGKKTLFTGKLDLAEELHQVLENISFSIPFEIQKRENNIVIKIKE
jgi:hypothetical protein